MSGRGGLLASESEGQPDSPARSWRLATLAMLPLVGIAVALMLSSLLGRDPRPASPGADVGRGRPTGEIDNSLPDTPLNRPDGPDHGSDWSVPPLSPCEGRYGTAITAAAEAFRLPPELIRAVIEAESGCRRFAISPAGAVGLMQIVPQTGGRHARKLLTGQATTPALENLFDPTQNIWMGAAYLHHLWGRFGEMAPTRAIRTALVLAAYNAGPTFLAAELAEEPPSPGRWPHWAHRHLPGETSAYVERILQDKEGPDGWISLARSVASRGP